ncbi:ABC transporter permease [Chloroflexota bacterium]
MMKLLSNYIKEMKIAARGFYFYIEIGMAVILLAILLFAVSETSTSNSKQFIYNDMPQKIAEYMKDKSIEDGDARLANATEFKLKPAEFEITNRETGETTAYDFDDEKIIELETFEMLDSSTGERNGTVYYVETEEDMIRLTYSESDMSATVAMDPYGKVSNKYYLQGYETDRLKSLLYILQNESRNVVNAKKDKQAVRTLEVMETLNNRENLVPIFIAYMGSLMGFFIVMAYIFYDKAEGVIRAFTVTPSSIWKYLISKIFVILTTVVVSSSVITIPVMGGQPNYLLFYVFLIVTTFALASLGLLVASFFDNISKSFGVMYAIMISLMIPGFSYYIPSFDPLWLRFFPSYPLLQGFKEIMLNGDTGYVLTYSFVFLVGGLILFVLANIRFKKTLTV